MHCILLEGIPGNLGESQENAGILGIPYQQRLKSAFPLP